MKVYIICPVRNAKENILLSKFVNYLEQYDFQCHYPLRDMDQTLCGTDICNGHLQAMFDCDVILIYWNGQSIGSHFDFGMGFFSKKPIFLFNKFFDCPIKSYGQVVKEVAIDLMIKNYLSFEIARKILNNKGA